MLKRMLKIAVIILIVPITLWLLINLYALISAAPRLYASDEGAISDLRADAILVLGAGVRADKTPSNMLEDRLLTALDLYEKGVSENIIVSGDHGTKEYDEVNVMKSYLIERGVPSERIFMDHAGFSTYDSLYRAEAIFSAESLVVVTQKYHAPRALMIGSGLGMDCKAVWAPVITGQHPIYPKQGWYSLRESFARCKDFFYCLAKPQPKFLGEKISLGGSGDVTNDL